MSSRIVRFYREAAPDDRGRWLNQMQSQSLEELEHVHDYIQWLFPLTTHSSFNPDAPVLGDADIQAFRNDPGLRMRLVRSLRVMLPLYGLELEGTDAEPVVKLGSRFEERAAEWITPCNHNFLRLSRILGSLSLLGCEAQALALLACLHDVYQKRGEVIGARAFAYWERAVIPEGGN